MGNDHEQRRPDTIPELDRETTGDSVNSRSGDIGDIVDRDARRLDHHFADEPNKDDANRDERDERDDA